MLAVVGYDWEFYRLLVSLYGIVKRIKFCGCTNRTQKTKSKRDEVRARLDLHLSGWNLLATIHEKVKVVIAACLRLRNSHINLVNAVVACIVRNCSRELLRRVCREARNDAVVCANGTC